MTQVQTSERVEIVGTIADAINKEHQLFEAGMRSSLIHAIHCGELLIQQKAQLEHGEWLPWVMMNCDFSDRRARQYMEIANRNTCSDLGGATSIKSALKIIAEERQEAAPEPDPEPVVTAFSWLHDEKIEAMLDAIETVQSGISILLKADRDRGVAYHLLSMKRAQMLKMVEDIDRVLGDR